MWYPRFLRQRPTIVTFVPFLCTVLLWNLAFGGLKFLIKNLTAGHLAMSPGILLEHVVAYLSLGCVIAYAFGGCVCHSLSKRFIVFASAAVAIVALLAEYRFGLASELSLIFTSTVIGLCFGLFSIARSVLSCYEIKKTGLPDTAVNGTVMVLVITASIIGAYVSTKLFELIGVETLWVFVCFFLLICILSFWLRYRGQESIMPFRESAARVHREFLFVLKHRSMILLPSAAIWAITLIVGIKSIPYAERAYGIPESLGSLALMATAAGAVMGNAVTLSTPARRRWFWFRFSTYTFAALVVLFPVLTQTFRFMVCYSFLLGIAMGAATNLVDSAYLRFISENNVKENGSAASGMALNIFIAFLLALLNLLPPVTHFAVLGTFAVGMGFFVLLKLHILDGEIRE